MYNKNDFSCTNPDDMNYETLAKKARYFKQDEKGVTAMCSIKTLKNNNSKLNHHMLYYFQMKNKYRKTDTDERSFCGIFVGENK